MPMLEYRQQKEVSPMCLSTVYVLGEGEKEQIAKNVAEVKVRDGRLYFTDGDYHYVSTDMDGEDLKTIVEKEIYYPYFICSDWMVFQDDADHESLHIYNTTYGTEVNITDTPSHSPILDGKYLYYVDAEDGYYLCRVDMSDPEALVPEWIWLTGKG